MLEFVAAGYLFFSQNMASNYYALEGALVSHRAGVHLELSVSPKGPTLYVDTETLIDKRVDDTSFHPVQVNYTVGVSQRLGGLELIVEKKCLHPVDGTSKGMTTQDYFSAEVRLNF